MADNKIFIQKGAAFCLVSLEIATQPKKFLKVLEPQPGAAWLAEPSAGKFIIIDVPGEQEPIVLLKYTATQDIQLCITDDLTAIDDEGCIYFSVRNETY